MDRRRFLVGTFGAAFLASRPADAFAQQSSTPSSSAWDAGRVRHLLPTVSDTRLLIKASFRTPLKAPPTLRVGATAVRGRMNDTAGECWQFYAADLAPARRHALSLADANGASLCQPWELSTFPARESMPDRFRALFFTCAGGPENAGVRADAQPSGNLPTAVRNRLLRRGLSFQPDAAIANGDHVYWDLHAPRTPIARRNTTRLDSFNRSALVFGDKNETVLKLAAAPQIVPVYGTDFRSTPVFFLQDDHDYFDNDEGTDEIVTFPTVWFQLQLARATQRMYYPEFLPDAARPPNLPWVASDNGGDVSESFGTLRFGRLAEILLYDVRRTVTLGGASAVFVAPEIEQWLNARTNATDVTHLVHEPSNPPGWTAGKWGEWYPDILDEGGKLTTAKPKPYWQSGWLQQHDRLMRSISAMDRAGAAGGERRPPCRRPWTDAARRVARLSRAPDQRRALGADWDVPGRVAVGGPRRRGDAARAPGHAGRREADRAARVRAGGLSARPDRPSAVQVGRQDAVAGRDRHARALPHRRVGAVGRDRRYAPVSVDLEGSQGVTSPR